MPALGLTSRAASSPSRFWRESSLIIPKNYDAPRRHGIPTATLKDMGRTMTALATEV
jgi:hypothetical protein